jgi:protein-L-isoaspartate(D-aspartate) O-methyltransferase
MASFEEQRVHMVEEQLVRRDITDPRLLQAFLAVPREEFVPAELAELAYDDTPLPIGEGQTISQPYIVALTIQALGLTGEERVLEVGTGSSYAAAILSHLVQEVYTIERVAALAETARQRLERLGYGNVHVIHADGSLGWQDRAPYAAIAVAATGPQAPRALLEQLTRGGRLVMPIGLEAEPQMLVRITREDDTQYVEESLADVRFVPLIGRHGFDEEPLIQLPRRRSTTSEHALALLIREEAEPLADIEQSSLAALLDRIGDARLVLLGEATHGTSEFYRMRARISQSWKELPETYPFGL